MIQNTGFETADPSTLEAGIAQYWVADTIGTGEETATFAGDTGRAPLGYETFGHGWGWLDPQRVRVSLAFGEVLSVPAEEFSAWALNQAFIGIGAAEAATFDSHSTPTEAFSNWGAGVDRDFVLTSAELARAQFNGAGQETFVWGAFVTSLDNTAVAAFDDETNDTEVFAYRGKLPVYANATTFCFVRADGLNWDWEQDSLVTLHTSDKLPEGYSDGSEYYVRSIIGSTVRLGTQPTYVDGSSDMLVTDEGSGHHWILADAKHYWTEVLP